MKKSLSIFVSLFLLICLGAGCSADRNSINEQDVKAKNIISWNITDSGTTILRDGVEIGGLNDVSSKDTLSENFVLFRQNATYVYFGVKAKSLGYDLGFKKLYRLSLQNNQLLPITGSLSGFDELYVADVSPDDRLVAFVFSTTDRNQIILKNIDGHSERKIEVNNKNDRIFTPKDAVWKLGDVHFSPDSTKVAFAFLQYNTDPKNPSSIIEALGNFGILNLKKDESETLETGYVPRKNMIVRIRGWNSDGTVDYTSEEKDELYKPFVSTGRWKTEYGETNIDGKVKPYVIAYTGNETINVWLSRTAPGWTDKENLILGLDESSLNKLPLNIKDRGLEEVVLYPGSTDFEQIKKQLQDTSREKPLQLHVKLFREFEGEIFISTDITSVYYKNWRLIRGDFTDTCSHPTYVGNVRVRGWLEKKDCNNPGDPYCIPLSFKVVKDDSIKLPKTDAGTVYLGDDLDKMVLRQLEGSSKNNPKTVELTEISWYCEGYQPGATIGRVL